MRWWQRVWFKDWLLPVITVTLSTQGTTIDDGSGQVTSWTSPQGGKTYLASGLNLSAGESLTIPANQGQVILSINGDVTLNKASISFRFKSYGSEGKERGDIDNVVITGRQ